MCPAPAEAGDRDFGESRGGTFNECTTSISTMNDSCARSMLVNNSIKLDMARSEVYKEQELWGYISHLPLLIDLFSFGC